MTLSGGNQQKVLFGRTLARDPEVLVLCEPTAGVDIGARHAIYDFVAEQVRAWSERDRRLVGRRRPARAVHAGARAQRRRGGS